MKYYRDYSKVELPLKLVILVRLCKWYKPKNILQLASPFLCFLYPKAKLQEFG